MTVVVNESSVLLRFVMFVIKVLTLSIRENCTAIGSVQYSLVLVVNLISRKVFLHPVFGLSDAH